MSLGRKLNTEIRIASLLELAYIIFLFRILARIKLYTAAKRRM